MTSRARSPPPQRGKSRFRGAPAFCLCGSSVAVLIYFGETYLHGHATATAAEEIAVALRVRLGDSGHHRLRALPHPTGETPLVRSHFPREQPHPEMRLAEVRMDTGRSAVKDDPSLLQGDGKWFSNLPRSDWGWHCSNARQRNSQRFG